MSTDGLPNMRDVLNGGKYAAECSAVHELVQAESVLLVVMGGARGHGFAISIDNRRAVPAIALAALPDFLRGLADAIEESGLNGPPIPAAGNA